MTIVRPSRSVLLLLCLISCGLPGCERSAATQASHSGLNLILISMDTTRADHLGCYGHPWIETPNIDRLAAEGTIFTQCTSAVPITLPSHSSIFTGTYPFVHKVRDNGTFQLHLDNLTLTEVLRDAGYQTAAQVGAFVLNHEFGLDQGFAEYRDVKFTAAAEIGQRAVTEINAEQVTDGAIELLRGLAGRRFFLFVHYFDPHQIYQAPPRFADKYFDAYAAEISYTDEQIGRLLAVVRELGVADDTLIVLTSDHGEGRGQHNESTHAFFVYDATLSVPLIFWRPGRIPAGGRIAAQVRTIDIAPTTLALLNLPKLPDAEGVDLSPLIFGEATDLGLTAYAETFCPKYGLALSQLRALRDGQWKYIRAPQPELYNIVSDPGELDNRAAAHPEVVTQMRDAMRALIEEAPRVVESDQARHHVSADDRRALEALGYIGGEPAEGTEESQDELALFDPDGPSPVDNVRIIELFSEAAGLIGTDQHARIERVLRSLLDEAGERSAGMVWAHIHLAGALAARNKLEEALKQFELSVQARPDDGQLRTAMGIVLRGLGRNDEAIAAFEKALTLEPVFALTHLKLAEALAAAGRNQEAIEQYRHTIEKDQTEMRAYVGLAAVLAKSGRVAEAVKTIDRAIEVSRREGAKAGMEKLESLRARYQQMESPEPGP